MVDAFEDPRSVYFIRGKQGGPIKVGVAGDVAQRLANLQVGHWQELECVATVDSGGLDLERLIHERFAAHHVRGEWFNPDPELLAFIAVLNHEQALLGIDATFAA